MWNLKNLNAQKQSRMVRSRGSGEMVAKGYTLPVIRRINSGDLMYNMMI